MYDGIIAYTGVVVAGILFYMSPEPLLLGVLCLTFVNLFHLRHNGTEKFLEEQAELERELKEVKTEMTSISEDINVKLKKMTLEIDEAVTKAAEADDKAGQLSFALGSRLTAGSR